MQFFYFYVTLTTLYVNGSQGLCHGKEDKLQMADSAWVRRSCCGTAAGIAQVVTLEGEGCAGTQHVHDIYNNRVSQRSPQKAEYLPFDGNVIVPVPLKIFSW